MPSSESVCVSTEVLEVSGVGVSAWVYNLEQISGFKTPDQVEAGGASMASRDAMLEEDVAS